MQNLIKFELKTEKFQGNVYEVINIYDNDSDEFSFSFNFSRDGSVLLIHFYDDNKKLHYNIDTLSYMSYSEYTITDYILRHIKDLNKKFDRNYTNFSKTKQVWENLLRYFANCDKYQSKDEHSLSKLFYKLFKDGFEQSVYIYLNTLKEDFYVKLITIEDENEGDEILDLVNILNYDTNEMLKLNEKDITKEDFLDLIDLLKNNKKEFLVNLLNFIDVSEKGNKKTFNQILLNL